MESEFRPGDIITSKTFPKGRWKVLKVKRDHLIYKCILNRHGNCAGINPKEKLVIRFSEISSDIYRVEKLIPNFEF